MTAASIPAIQPLFRSRGRPKHGAYVPPADSHQGALVKRPKDPYALPSALDATIDGRDGSIREDESYHLESQEGPWRDESGLRRTIEITVASAPRIRAL